MPSNETGIPEPHPTDLPPELAANGATAGPAASNVRFLVGAVVAAAAVAYIAMSSFDNEVYFLTVAEVSEQYDEFGDREFRLKGNVVPGSHETLGDSLSHHRFALTEGGETMTVYFEGPLPDTFSDDAEVIALGQLIGEGEFEATEVVAKCPSRYEGEVPTAQLDN